MQINIKKPVFFIGVPRSGTTISFEIFSTHPLIGWFSKWLERFPAYPAISVLSRLANYEIFRGAKPQGQNMEWFKKHLPHSSEGYTIWEKCCGKKFRYSYLQNKKATEQEKNDVTEVIEKVLFYHGKARFAAKLTGPARIKYLNSIFPDAFFIHIVRDGRGVVNSLFNVEFWKNKKGFQKPWWDNGLTSEDMECYRQSEYSPWVLAAIQWRRIIIIARKEAKLISKNRYLEVHYEDIIRNPHEVINNIFKFCDMPASHKTHNYIKKQALRNMNTKFSHSIPKKNLEIITNIMYDLLKDFGYI